MMGHGRERGGGQANRSLVTRPPVDVRRGSSSTPIISARGLSKWYGLVMGLNNVNLEIFQGVTGLLGPNGAGKSTFLKLLTGQLATSKGEIKLYGSEVRNNPALMARIGYCPEADSFYSWMTGLEFVTALLQISGFRKYDAVVMAEESLKLLDMTDAMDRKIAGYSKGMRQRVKIAQAIAHDPDLLILDEPLSGTDPVGRVRIINVIKHMEKLGKDVIVSSHVLHDVERITRSIVLINQGRIIAQGDVHAIRALMDEHPQIVRIRTPQGRKLAEVLTALSSVVSLEFVDDLLVVKTSKPDVFYTELPRVVTECGIPITELTSPDDNLDAVFRYLVE